MLYMVLHRSGLWRERPAGPDDRPSKHIHWNAVLDGSRGDCLWAQFGSHIRQPERFMEFGYHGPGNGRIAAAAMWHASHASSFPHPSQSSAPSQVQKVGQKVPQLHRDGLGQGLPPASVHRAFAKASVHPRSAYWTTGPYPAQGSHRSVQETQATERYTFAMRSTVKMGGVNGLPSDRTGRLPI